MTKMKYRDRPIWHQSYAIERGREICAAEGPHHCHIRLKGTRQVLLVPWSAIYTWAARFEAERLRKKRIEDRKAARKAKATR